MLNNYKFAKIFITIYFLLFCNVCFSQTLQDYLWLEQKPKIYSWSTVIDSDSKKNYSYSEKRKLEASAIATDSNGSFYISTEKYPKLLRFDSGKKIQR